MHHIPPITRTAPPCVRTLVCEAPAAAKPAVLADRYSVVTRVPVQLHPLRANGGVIRPSSAETNAAKVPQPRISRLPHPSPIEAVGDCAYSHLAGLVGYVELLGVRFSLHTPYKASLPAVGPEGIVVRDTRGHAIPAGIVRGSRIGDADIAWLARHGFNGVLSLTAEGDSHEQELARAYGMSAERIRILDNHPPTIAEVKRALDFMRAHKPVYVHCAAGIGRTGTMVAAYRIAVEGCTVQQALAETAQYGKLVPWQRDFIRELPAVLARGRLPGYRLHGNAAREHAVNKA